MSIKDFKKGYTHAGTFHADDVFSTALLKSVNPDIEIERTFTPPTKYGSDVIVYDVGSGKYDHHEKEELKECRADGTPYAAFGKIWRDFGIEICGSQVVADSVEISLVKPIDITDNTGERNPLSLMVHVYNPTWEMDGSPDALNKAFFEAVDAVKPMLEREIEHAKAAERAKQIVRQANVDKNNVLVLDRYVPSATWSNVILEEMPDIDFVVFPSNRGGYNIQKVPIEAGSLSGRVDFPKEWCGYRVENDDPNFAHIDKSLGLTFCHPGNFLASADTLDHAVNLAHIAAKEGQKNVERNYRELPNGEKLESSGLEKSRGHEFDGIFNNDNSVQKGLGE